MSERFWSDEELLGYLLEALEPNEMLSVEEALHQDPMLSQRLHELRALMLPWCSKEEAFAPPDGLVDRVMEAIESSSLADDAQADTDVPYPVAPSISDSLSAEAHEARRDRSWIDIAVAIAVCIICLCIHLARSVENTRNVACNAMRQPSSQLRRDDS